MPGKAILRIAAVAVKNLATPHPFFLNLWPVHPDFKDSM
jgi:hypothetical protein